MPFGPVCQHAVVALADQRQKLRARFVLVAEHAKHCTGNSGGTLLFTPRIIMPDGGRQFTRPLPVAQ